MRAHAGDETAAARAVTAAGGTVGTALPIIDGFTAQIAPAAIPALRGRPGIEAVTPDGQVKSASAGYDARQDGSSLFNLENVIGARQIWNRYTGAGIDVAVIDSGVTPVAGLDTPGKVLNGPDLTEESQNPATDHLDTFGHGTFMASLIAGHDAGVDPATNQGNATPFLGVAPNARIVSVKVGDALGMTDVSQVIAGIDWVVQHAHSGGLNIRVLNLSFGTDSLQSYQLDPLAYAAEVAWKHGIVVVTSAGNGGTSLGHLTDPAIDPDVIAVGADDTNGSPPVVDDTVPAFSSRGDGTRNPDLVAPGTHVEGLRVPGSYVDDQYSSTGAITDRFFRGSGTSEAAAITSGAVALLVNEYPTYTPDQIKAVLVATAQPLRNTPATAQGAGLINLLAASAPVTVPPVQSFPAGTGTGSLDAARGSHHLVLNGVTLKGSHDIFGHTVKTSALAKAEAAGTSWSGGTWNGSAWTGTSWSGSSWSGTSWSGNDWSGTSWSSDDWSTGEWSGTSWSGTSWSGTSWSGSSWSGTSWSGTSWSDTVWSTSSWS